MKQSNKLLLGAGLTLAVLILASVITARVIFDRSVVVRPTQTEIVILETRF